MAYISEKNRSSVYENVITGVFIQRRPHLILWVILVWTADRISLGWSVRSSNVVVVVIIKRKCVNYTVYQKVHPFYFCDYSVKSWPILLLNLRKFTTKWRIFSYIQFMYEYYRIEKQERCFQCCRFIYSRRASLAAFSKDCLVPAVPKLYLEIP